LTDYQASVLIQHSQLLVSKQLLISFDLQRGLSKKKVFQSKVKAILNLRSADKNIC